MRDDKSDASPLDGAAGTVSQAAQTAGQIQKTVNQARQGAGAAQKAAHTSQAAYVATASAQGGAAAAGATTGTALAGPLGTVVGVIVTSKTFWKVVGGILMAIFLWMFIIANLIGIILTYLGFADADAFANEAQSEELANLKVRVEQILDKEEYEHEIMAIIEQNRDVRLEEIAADKQEKYNDYELSVIDEYETKFKRNASYYLSIFLLDIWDSNTRNEFLGYSSEWGDMTTNLSSPYDAYFQEAAQSYGVPVALLKAMGKTESNFNQSAVSSAGAIGVMQLMPGTAASLGVDPYDARQNIMGGAKYIAGNLEQFKGYSNGLELAIAAYNAGPGAVIKYGYQIPPYKETQNYVKKVLGYLTIEERKNGNNEGTETDEDLSEPYQQLKTAVTEHVDSFFSWSVTDKKEREIMESVYYQILESGKQEIDQTTYEKLKADGENVVKETVPVMKQTVEYTLALLLSSQPVSGSGYEYKYVTSQSTFELVLKVLKVMDEGVSALKDAFFSLFSWKDFVTGGGEDTYVSNIDASGDIFTYDTVGKGVKKVVYFNQTEEPWDYFVNNLRQNYIAGDVLDTLRRLEELFCTEVGIPSARSDKKERMISSEAESNDVETSTRMEMWLDGWKKSCDDVKKMFGVEVSVNWRHNPNKKSVSREPSGGDDD